MREIVERAKQLRRLDRNLGRQLPSPLAEHCRVANVTNNTLIVLADDPTWAARLRYAAPSILSLLSDETDLALTAVQVKVAPPSAPSRKVTRQRLRLSEKNAAGLRTLALNISDQKLAEKILRLAQHGERSTDTFPEADQIVSSRQQRTQK